MAVATEDIIEEQMLFFFSSSLSKNPTRYNRFLVILENNK
jgi:hypothetical protein